MELTNNTGVKSSMSPQAYKVVTTHAHEISGWKILYSFVHAHAPRLGGMNGDVQSDLSIPEFNNGEQLEDFHSRILRLQQQTNLYRKKVSPKRFIIQYTKEFTKRNTLKDFIAPKITYLSTFLDNNRKSAIYKV